MRCKQARPAEKSPHRWPLREACVQPLNPPSYLPGFLQAATNSPTITMKKLPPLLLLLMPLLLSSPGCEESVGMENHEETHEEQHEGHHGSHQRILATSPQIKSVVTTQQYVCQIHSCRHIDIRAMEGGYLEEITIKEGQRVEQGDPLFKIVPTLFQARLDTEVAEAQVVQIEFDNTKKLFQDNVVSDKEVALAKAKLAKAIAKMKLAQAELNFAEIKAPFPGIIDRLHMQQGSLIEEGEDLTTLSDNSVMWVYFNVPEAQYLEYQTRAQADKDDMRIELVLANGASFPQEGMIGAIEADFNNETGNIAFRADFPNPDGLLRHGQTGNILIHRVLHDAVVIPQRATFEVLANRYVYVIGEDGVVRQRLITIKNEMEDIFVLEGGLEEGEKIILEGVRQVRDGQEVEYEFREPEEVLSDLKYEAE